MNDVKYFKTVYTIEVLTTDEAMINMGMKDIAYECTDGDCSGVISQSVVTELTRDEIVAALEAQGSDSEYFLNEYE